MKTSTIWLKIWNICLYVFAGIGLFLVLGYVAVEFGLTKTEGIVDKQHGYFQEKLSAKTWNDGEEWIVLKEALLKEKSAIDKVATQTGVPARLILAPLVVEQLRLFHSSREIFKSAFAPLKILGNQSQFSWGVMGMKQDTAREIEKNLKVTSSPFYLGKKYESLLDFPASMSEDEKDSKRFTRLTDENDRTFSYLYTALLMKQYMTQWERAGFPITYQPGVILTLFNIGFQNSKPHLDPQTGGAEIDINGEKYSFGGLGELFFHSDELVTEFPRN